MVVELFDACLHIINIFALGILLSNTLLIYMALWLLTFPIETHRLATAHWPSASNTWSNIARVCSSLLNTFETKRYFSGGGGVALDTLATVLVCCLLHTNLFNAPVPFFCTLLCERAVRFLSFSLSCPMCSLLFYVLSSFYVHGPLSFFGQFDNDIVNQIF